MFTAGGGHARLSCRQGTDLWIDMVCKLVPYFMPCENGYGVTVHTPASRRYCELRKNSEMQIDILRNRKYLFGGICIYSAVPMERISSYRFSKDEISSSVKVLRLSLTE